MLDPQNGAIRGAWIVGASLVLANVASFSFPSSACADEAATWRKLDTLFEAFAEEQRVPGLVYGVVEQGQPVHLRGIGVQDLGSKRPVGPDTAFSIASLTKSFVALSVLKLRDQGRLNLSDPIGSKVPELRILAPGALDPRPITIRDLLTHSAGFVTDDPWADRQLGEPQDRFLEFLRQGIPLAQAPGTAFEYSNLGYALLGLIVSRTAGRRYQDFVDDSILRPLGMSATRWNASDASADRLAVGYSWVDGHYEAQPRATDGAFGAAAGLVTTASDYARFVAWVLSAWNSKADEAAILDPASVREAGRGMVFSQVGSRNRPAGQKDCPVAWQYGYGFYVVTDCELGTMLRHPGGLPGFGSQLLLLPQDGVGIFAFATLTYAGLAKPVVDAALELRKLHLAQPQAAPLSPALRRTAAVIEAIYRAGDVAIDRGFLAENLLLDAPADRRNAELQADKLALGSCGSPIPQEIRHALGARFSLHCEHGSLLVTVLLAPTAEPRIQYLVFEQSRLAGKP